MSGLVSHRYLVHAEGAGNDGAQEDHDAVELAQLVATQHGEGDGGGDAVEEDGGDETPHEDRHPGKFESVPINGTCFHANKMLPFYQCCGSGSGIWCLFDPWIRDPGWVESQHPDPG